MTNGFVSPYQMITDRILADLENGVAGWVKPWKSDGTITAGLPMNFSTKSSYRGINTLMLYMATVANDWSIPAFATFKQIQKMKGTVKKGSKGEHVYFMSTIERDPKTPEEEARVNENGKYEQFILKGFTVFNIDQIEGIELDISAMPKASELPADVVELCQTVGVKLTHGGDQAFYAPKADKITMPKPETFETMSHYKATAFHEVGHATGAESRLNRQFGKRFGDQAYAFEELVAELTAAFLCMEFGVEGNLRHPEYIASWIKVLKDDNRAFYRAAAEAQKAVDWIREQAVSAPAEQEREAA